MLAPTEMCRDLVLVGGGHSHVLALRMLAMRPIAGLRITLISVASHSPYSGMLPGLIAGHYSFEQTHIDLARLCQWAGARFITAEVTALVVATKQLLLSGRAPVSYDVVSLDIGSEPDLDSVPGARDYATPVKPVAGLWQRWEDLYKRLRVRTSTDEFRISVVGGGAGSVELVLAMAQQLQGQAVRFELWCAAPVVLPGVNARTRRAVTETLARWDIRVHLNTRVTAVAANTLTASDGTVAAYDELFWCTGAAPAPWIAASGLATDEKGFLTVRDTLQSTQDDTVFAAGDIAVQVNYPRPKAGVFAVRQGPVLAHNLHALLLRKPLQQHRPQQRFLALISLGDKRAVADKGPFSVFGHWVWRWKDQIDRAFMAQFQDLPDRMSGKAHDSLPELQDVEQQAICGGCGAKVGADALAAALAQLRQNYPQHCVGSGDDVATVPQSTNGPLVQSLDVLRELVSDPWTMGRIAAQHALSDLYASGARPVSALATITLPYANNVLLGRELQQLLAGALHELSAADCRLTGGHSMQGPELSVGFVVNGIALAPNGTLLPKVGAQLGDQLILTKALGTGVLFAAHMQLGADGRDIAGAVASMLHSNDRAAALAAEYGAHACTDITGFGLVGHLLEMLADVRSAHLTLAQVPVLGGALHHLQNGIVSSMHAANTRSARDLVQCISPLDEARVQLLFDPQTSGGLLLAVPRERAAALCEGLRDSGYARTCVIGEVVASAADKPRAVMLG